MSSYGQVTPPPEKTSAELLQLGRSQTTAGWIFAASGLALLVAGAATHQNVLEQWYLDEEADNTMSNGMMGLGSAAMVGSVFFFLSGSRNKDKAAYLEMTSHLTRTPQLGASGSKVQPGISLKITF
ncbi:hypothetical protein DC20_06440 [Rufibacter tibetensis]|uniref:Uncharacterized protein n=1 Tax=Rufibacter tibetensis TaxID=512763 RepID=A0A0P0CVX4_9BACT|nr:hypothetical protein DC20_06440 [Rufibacter tibetensis]